MIPNLIQQSGLSEPPSNNMGRWSRRFILSAGVIFLITGLAKIISAFGAAKILNDVDPIFGMSFRHLMLFVGFMELIVSGICFSKKANLSLGLVTWMAICFIVYRVGSSHTGWHRPCSCMGNLTDALHISPQTGDAIMKIILAYLLIGSCCLIGLQWKLTRLPKSI